MRNCTILCKKTVRRTRLEICVIIVPKKRTEIRKIQMRMVLVTLVAMIMMVMVSFVLSF